MGGSYPIGRQAVIAKLRAAVAASQMPLLKLLEHVVTAGAANLLPADLLRAIEDALRDSDPVFGPLGPERLAEAFEAEAALALYPRHMASNFHVIDDLASQRPLTSPVSPAHLTYFERAEEFAHWDSSPAIATLSYVTVSRNPFRFCRGCPAPVWELANPFTYPELTKDKELSRDTDLVYRACYRACAGGPFQMPPQRIRVDRCVGPNNHTTIQVGTTTESSTRRRCSGRAARTCLWSAITWTSPAIIALSRRARAMRERSRRTIF